MKKETILIGAAAVGLFLLCARKRKAGTQAETVIEETDIVRYLPLDALRRGIKESWYKAELTIPADGEYWVILHGLLVDGREFMEKYPIEQATFEALKADGIPIV